PYNVLIYRLLKELLTNVFKHSDGNRAWVMLTQKDSMIELCVSDDGNANADCLLTIDRTKHKGIAAITERVNSMEGSIIISDNTPHGICVQITMPMKGADSYQYFVS
ncbi:MAG: ATP-binding protein, partial [Lachnospiraceae bacterium]|nr:ATP-binding protein [Lachnospiraceae bacterium]